MLAIIEWCRAVIRNVRVATHEFTRLGVDHLCDVDFSTFLQMA
jgi:hypothetical protein